MQDPDDHTLKPIEGFIGRYQHKLKAALTTLRDGLKEETVETREMLEIYSRYSVNQATNEEMRRANRQLKDLIKMMGLGVLLVLPMAPISIPLIVKLGHRLGVDVLPSMTRGNNKPDR